MGRTTYTTARWPEKVRNLSREPIGDRPEVREELWLVLQIVLARYARMHARQLGMISREEIEDLVSEKSLHLFRRIETGHWGPEGKSDGEIAAYLSKIARNGVVDALRLAGRVESPASGESDHPAGEVVSAMQEKSGTGDRAIGRQFAEAVRACSSRLEKRARLAWMMRVFLDMKSKRIGAHPLVDRNPGAVDVLLKRTRRAMKECMQKKGFSTSEIPRGTFARLYQFFNRELKEIEP